ncbi:MAG: PIN domain-containing protein [Rudanella sp.]|nr:PIN domain-containing protein [Rudanella sp.]
MIAFPFTRITANHGPTLRFDRLILATALAEGIPVISADEKFARYRDIVEVIW